MSKFLKFIAPLLFQKYEKRIKELEKENHDLKKSYDMLKVIVERERQLIAELRIKDTEAREKMSKELEGLKNANARE